MILAYGCGDEALTHNPGGGGTGIGGHGNHGGGGGGGAPVPTASFEVRGSVNQIMVWKTPPGSAIQVLDGNGTKVLEGTSDEQGSLIFRKVAAADDYQVSVPTAPSPNLYKPVKVTTPEKSLPDPSFYSGQKLKPGYNYITTRDGTQLAAYVTLPGPIEKGPYPTVVNYSGYNPAEPGAPLGDFAALCADLPVLCDAPHDASAMIAALNGYATVGVNMRGTGCSGGAYDYFETLQLLDGYDIIETVAAQDFVLGNRVGMSGLSFPGISQLFVARTHPPHLAAISPFSVIGNTYTTGRPGGIFNDGFALEWITNVLAKAHPYAQGWEQGMVDKGDKVCEDNQLLHSQLVDAVQEIKDHLYYDEELVTPVNPTAFVHEIDVPVFLAGAWEDEQTGPFFFTLLDKFTSSPLTRFTTYNGVHPDGFAPQVLVEWKAFLDIYVAHQVPKISDEVRQLAPVLFEQFFQTTLNIPPDRFATYATWEDAKAAYEAEKPLRAIFEDGGNNPTGAPLGTTELHFDKWPPAETTPLRLYFQPDGSLAKTAPTDTFAASTFTLDPDAGHRGILAPGGDVWDPLPDYDWKQPAPGADVIFESAALTEDLVMLGTASVDLWLRAQVDDADLEANLMEIRPDGQERYIQSGWLRASLRKLGPLSTEMWPDPTYKQEDEKLLVPGEWTAARIGIAGFSHVFRKGSRIRVTVDTPGDSRASWQFALKTFPGTVSYDVAHSAMYPSSVVLPVIGGQASTTPMPACPSLRAQQCRPYQAYTNVPAAP